MELVEVIAFINGVWFKVALVIGIISGTMLGVRCGLMLTEVKIKSKNQK